ncbi:dihydrolipoyl dehydrogenase family protein [Coleofasciculus sp. H7-2]|uniref:dihydrolipoyl dehydrogenase family protein n=1 Tax=Coleofasciculus sp. H7-2 TaxID=3351545 RepID=UPI00366AE832
MAVEYDLVVIGGTEAGRHAAVAAANLQARVALVEPQPPPEGQRWRSSLQLGSIYSKALTQVRRVIHPLSDADRFGVPWDLADSTEQRTVPGVRFTEAIQWADSVVSTLEEQHSPAILASLGVDVIVGEGEFCRKPYLAFVVNGRRLRSRAYLIATGSRPGIAEIDGLQATGYLTPTDIWQQSPEQLPVDASRRPCWVVIGGGASGTELAQTLSRLGADVTLVVRSSHILPKEDPEAARVVHSQLEIEGVRVLTQTEVTQVKRIDGKKWVLAGNKAIEADEILLCTRSQPNVTSLNLQGVGVKMNRRGMELNEKLQTTNPRIYACGDVAGGYQAAHIAQYEACIALKNALFAPIFKVDYRGIPTGVFSEPMLARVGLTEVQARRQYGKDVLVLRQYFKTVAAAQILGEITGFCKILVRRNGEILGATLVGMEAGELMGAIAIAMRQKIKVDALCQLPAISPTLSEIIQLTANEWHQQRLSNNTRLQDFLEGFFNLRRSWSS